MNRGFIETWLAGLLGTIAFMLLFTFVVATLVDTTAVKATMVAETPWYVHLAEAEAALDADDLATAMHHWRAAYTAAMSSRRSHGMVEVGDVYRRLGARGHLGASAVARARECYLTALLRARGERSIDGVLRATEAFLDLRDDTMVTQGLQLARALAARDPDPRARARVEMLAARAARSATPRQGTVASSWPERSTAGR